MKEAIKLLILMIIPCVTFASGINQVVIQFKLPANGRASLFYLSNAYQEKRIVFKNPASVDSIISQKLSVTENEIVRSSYAISQNGKLSFTEQHLLLPLNDTVRLTLDKDYNLICLDSKGVVINNFLKLGNELNEPLKFSSSKRSFEDIYEEINATYETNQAKIRDVVSMKLLDNRAVAALTRMAELEYYSKLFVLVLEKKRFEFLNDKLEAFLQHVPELQKVHSLRTRKLFERYTRYLIGKENLDPDDISNNFKYAIAAQWNKDITFGFLHENLSDYSPKSNVVFKNCFQQLRQYAGEEYRAEVDDLQHRYFPVIRQMEKIYLVNKQGQKISLKALLSRHQGKLVLIDFWASWCVPCRQESPLFEVAKKKYQNKPIAFINLSLDEDAHTAAWIEAMKKDNLLSAANHYKLVTPKKSLLFQSFTISSIPRYILIDSSGRVVDSDFVRPSDKGFEKELNRYLTKQ